MPFAGNEILPRAFYKAVHDAATQQGVKMASDVARDFTAIATWESGWWSRIRDQQRVTMRARGVPPEQLPARYWVMYEGATYQANPDGSIDRGVLMFNSVQQPQVTDAEAFNYIEAAREGVALWKRQKDGGSEDPFWPWAGWTGLMSPDAIAAMHVGNEFSRHLRGVEMRWQVTAKAQANWVLERFGFTMFTAAIPYP